MQSALGRWNSGFGLGTSCWQAARSDNPRGGACRVHGDQHTRVSSRGGIFVVMSGFCMVVSPTTLWCFSAGGRGALSPDSGVCVRRLGLMLGRNSPLERDRLVPSSMYARSSCSGIGPVPRIPRTEPERASRGTVNLEVFFEMKAKSDNESIGDGRGDPGQGLWFQRVPLDALVPTFRVSRVAAEPCRCVSSA